MRITSKIALLFCIFWLCLVHAYYPKWTKSIGEATISWDVSGYYMYLPALFIYKDLKDFSFKSTVLEKYKPTPNNNQAFLHESGNYVMKYSMGLAVQYSPYFFIAHLWASNSSKYPADGFSFPYQFMLSFGSLITAFIGLYYLRKSLKEYFDDKPVALVLLLVVLATNYLNYTAIDGAMSHNFLFTLYSLLIYNTIQFYRSATLIRSIGIGFIVGLAALTRPTEIIACLIPLLWGLNVFSKTAIKKRFSFFSTNLFKILTSIIVVAAVGSLQLFYWKYVTDSWIVYSYQDQGFSWLQPHIEKGLFSFRCGWLIYTPIMGFAVLGLIPLFFKKKILFFHSIIFCSLFIYITFAWDIWWYGGTLGQRAMVQSYPVFLFPMACFFIWTEKQNKFFRYFIGFLCIVFIYLNNWWTYQAHGGGLFHTEQMTNAYFWQVIGRFEKNPEHLKLLDTNELFKGTPKDLELIYSNDFSDPELKSDCSDKELICLNKNSIRKSDEFKFKTPHKNFDWLRASADFTIGQKEWFYWHMSQFVIEFRKDNMLIKKKKLRIERLILHDGLTKQIHFDIEKPKDEFDKVCIYFQNEHGKKWIEIDSLEVAIFSE